MGSPNDAEFWRKEAEKYKKYYESLQQEFDEFQQDSRDLEAELQKQLDESDSKTHELRSANERINRDREGLRERLDSSLQDAHKQIQRLEDQLGHVTMERDKLQTVIRELEQSNDDLERAKRNALSSIEDFGKKLNDLIEKNALLESELDEKDALQVHIQRLREEARDLRQEINVREQKEKHFDESRSRISPSPGPSVPNGKTPSRIPRSVTVDGGTPSCLMPASGPPTPITPAARISALNIVGDLLRKVGALETKLATCRKYAAKSGDENAGSNGGPIAKQPHLSSNGLVKNSAA